MKHKLLIGILAVTVGAGLLGYLCGRNGVRPSIMPVADRQRVFYKPGYLEYDGIDGVCGPKTHFAQRLYEHEWKAVKIWKEREK